MKHIIYMTVIRFWNANWGR